MTLVTKKASATCKVLKKRARKNSPCGATETTVRERKERERKKERERERVKEQQPNTRETGGRRKHRQSDSGCPQQGDGATECRKTAERGGGETSG